MDLHYSRDVPFRSLYPQARPRHIDGRDDGIQRSRTRTNSIFVNFSVEIRQEDSLLSLYQPVPVLVSSRLGDQQPQGQDMSQALDMRLPSTSPFAEAALRAVAHHETRGDHTTRLNQQQQWDRTIFTPDNAARLIYTDMRGLLSLGQKVLSKEKVEDHAKAIPSENIEIDVPAESWMENVEPLKNVDAPLFHMLRDSIHTHTPESILFRWNALRVHMSRTGQMLENVVRQAEELVRRQWSPVVLELYFLLLDHNEALVASLPTILMDTETLERQLSAYCAALRVRFYLWRMIRPDPMCRLRTYKNHLKAECFRCYTKQLSGLIAQEFIRVRDPDVGQLEDVRRELVGKPVDVNSIAKVLTGTSSEFCTICQDAHLQSDCVSPLNCDCVLGRQCLQSLLNRDAPSSYACPNCRTRLHEPLRWKPVDISTGRDLIIGLLYALRTNITSLQFEIFEDPEPFSPQQRTMGFFARLIYGR